MKINVTRKGYAMRLDFHGRLEDQPEIRAGFIGCGSHALRNIYPVFQYAPVNLIATCDLELPRAQAVAEKFGAKAAYADFREMLARETQNCAARASPE